MSWSSSFNLTEECDMAFECLVEYVKWHLENDETELAPILSNTLGKFLTLPFKRWLSCDSQVFELTLKEWSEAGYKPPKFILSCMGARYLAPSLLERMVGPSIPDLGLPSLPFTLTQCQWGNEYGLAKRGTRSVEEFAKVSFKGMIACSIHWFFYCHPCKQEEVIAAFNHPAANPKIPPHKQLAIGVMRDLLILPRFGTMRNFWLKLAELIREGGHELGWSNGTGARVSTDEVYEFIKDSDDAVKMLQILIDIGMSKRRFVSAFEELGINFID